MGAVKRVARRKRVMFVSVATAITMIASILLLTLTASASGAVTGYSVAANGGTLNERSGPSKSAAVVGSLADHSPLDISCQTVGDNVDGSTIWDRLSNGDYVSDYWTTTPNFGTYSPGIPQCSGTSQPPPSSYHVHASVGTLHERSGPSATSSIVGGLGGGVSVAIACQTYGQNIDGSSVWDRLNSAVSGPYVTDYWIDGTLFARFTPGIPQCSGTAQAPPPSSREQNAVAWAEGIVHSSDPSWDYDDHRPWSGYCETFVERAFGTIYRFASALSQYNWQKSQGRIHTDTDPPPGVEVFYGGGNGFGHVALSIGGGQVITTWGFVGNRDNVRVYGVTQFSNPYYGWAPAPPGWPGR